MDKNYLKYLKYKNKYNQLKLQTGGGEDNDIAELKCIQLNLIKEVLQIQAADPMGECPASIERLIEIYKIANSIKTRISNLRKYKIPSTSLPPQLIQPPSQSTPPPFQSTPPPSQSIPPPFQSTPLEGCPSRAINIAQLNSKKPENEAPMCSRKNYIQNARILHPDKNKACEKEAEEKFKEFGQLCDNYKAKKK